jgi:predicted XRE-type DNA-binding protein
MRSKGKRVAVGSRKHEPKETVHAGSGNVFADLGLAYPDERLAKAGLAHQIGLLIAAEGLSQHQAADRLGIDQPKVSALLRGQLKGFSTGRLMRFITAMRRDVIISVRDPEDKKHPSVRVLVEA